MPAEVYGAALSHCRDLIMTPWRSPKDSDALGKVSDLAREINQGWCGDFATFVVDHLPGARFNWRTDHGFVEWNGRYYDAECPDGVDEVDDLPIFGGRGGQ
mgnify:FL=1